MDNNGDINNNLQEIAGPDIDGEKKSGAADHKNTSESMTDAEFDNYISDIVNARASADDDRDNADNADSVNNDDDSSENDATDDNQTDSGEEEEEAESAPPFRTFATQDEYQQEIDRIFNKRFKTHKMVTAQYEDIIGELKDFYGVDDSEKVIALLKKQLNNQRAEENGQELSDYLASKEQAKKAKLYDEQQATADKIAAERERLYSEAAEIAKSDKRFDLAKIYNSDIEFKDDLDNSGSVYLAYSKMLQRQSQQQQQQPKQNKTVRTFQENGAASGASSGAVSSTPSQLSDADFEEYIKKIENM